MELAAGTPIHSNSDLKVPQNVLTKCITTKCITTKCITTKCITTKCITKIINYITENDINVKCRTIYINLKSIATIL